MRNIKLSCLTGLALVLAGCGGGHRDGTAGATRMVTTTGQYKTLHFTLTMRDTYPMGEEPTADFTIENTGTEPVAYSYSSCGFISGRLTKNGTFAGKAGTFGLCTQNGKAGRFEPGVKQTVTITWPQKHVDPGQYTMDAQLAVYTLDDERFLTANGIELPQHIGPDPITFTRTK